MRCNIEASFLIFSFSTIFICQKYYMFYHVSKFNRIFLTFRVNLVLLSLPFIQGFYSSLKYIILTTGLKEILFGEINYRVDLDKKHVGYHNKFDNGSKYRSIERLTFFKTERQKITCTDL